MGGAARLGWFEPSAGLRLAGHDAGPARVRGRHRRSRSPPRTCPGWITLLDVVAAPLAVVAGALTMAGALGDASPLLRWSFALIAGGGTAGLFHGLNGLLRAGSTVTTAGLGNPLFASLETAGAFTLAAIAVLVPVVGLLLTVAVVTVIWRLVRRVRAGGRAGVHTA